LSKDLKKNELTLKEKEIILEIDENVSDTKADSIKDTGEND
jgi:hypothetical protein